MVIFGVALVCAATNLKCSIIGCGAVGAELADHAQHHRLGLRALELDLALAEIGLDAVELAEEVVVPEGAAELAVGDRFEADLFLLADDLLDLAVLDRLELVGADLAALAFRPRLLQRGGTQQAADMIGAERRLGAGHDYAASLSIVVPAQAGAHIPATVIMGPRFRGDDTEQTLRTPCYSAAASAAACFCSTKSYRTS